MYIYITENTHHKPYCTSNAFDVALWHSLAIGTIHPRKGEEFSVAEVEIPYSKLCGLFGYRPYSAVALTVTIDGTANNIYGWIDKIEEISVGARNNTRIYWHIDHWLTALKMAYRSMRFMEGRVKRGPAYLARPDTSEPRAWIYSDSYKIETQGSKGVPWGIVLYSSSDSTTRQTTLRVAFFPVGSVITYQKDGGRYSKATFTTEILYEGSIEEYMGLDADAIKGLWIGPIPPVIYPAEKYDYVKTSVDSKNTYAYYDMSLGNVMLAGEQDITSISTLKTTDSEKYLVIDPYGTIYGTVPWGLEVAAIKTWMDISPTGATLFLDFQKVSDTLPGVGRCPGEGRQIQIPLIPVSTTSNAMSSYVYSGQREYDLYTAQIQAEQSRKSGIANSGTSALSGAVGGAVAGGGIGAGIGAIAGLATSLLGSQVNYQLTKEYDAKSQAALDKLTANQTANINVAGGGIGWYYGHWSIVKMVRDETSLTELNTEQSELGYLTDSYITNCKSVIAGGGGLRIESLHVDGLSPEGNKYVQNLFEKGCYLDIIPPSDTDTTGDDQNAT